MTRQHPAHSVNADEPTSLRHYLATLIICGLVTLSATPLLGKLDLTNIVMLFLVTVLLIAVLLGLRPALFASVLSVGFFDFFFVPPRFSFVVHDGQYLVTLAVMLVVATVTGKLAAGLQKKAAESALEASRANALYEMARDLTGALTLEQVSEITNAFLARVLNGRATMLLADRAGKLSQLDQTSGIEPRFATIALEEGRTIDCLPLSDGYALLYLPLKAPMRVRGVLAIHPVKAEVTANMLKVEQGRLEAMASLVAIAVERLHYVEVAQKTQVEMVSERLRSSVLSAVSHDLRTPLTALVGLADSLTVCKPQLTGESLETAEAIRDQANEMSHLVSNLLEMARLHTGKVTLRKEWQPIEEVIGSSIKMLGRALAHHPVSVTLAKDLPLVEFDSLLIERVFSNLLENAAKYSTEGAGITIDVRRENAFLRVNITDRGPGFPLDEGSSLFEMFVRGETESTKPGVGLGLAICRAIIDVHEGTITASNLPEGGGCMSFKLPLGNPPKIEVEVEEAQTLNRKAL